MTDETEIDATEPAKRGPGRPRKTEAAPPDAAMRGEDEECLVVRLNRAHWIGEQRIDPPATLTVSLKQFMAWDKTGLASLVGVLK